MVYVRAGFFVSVEREEHPLAVVERKALSRQPDAAVVLGTAPDGLPLVLRITRHSSVEAPVLRMLGVSAAHQLPREVGAALAKLEEAVAAQARQEGLVRLGRETVYRTRDTCQQLLGSTLLARLLGEAGPLLPPPSAFQVEDSSRIAHTGVINHAPDAGQGLSYRRTHGSLKGSGRMSRGYEKASTCQGDFCSIVASAWPSLAVPAASPGPRGMPVTVSSSTAPRGYGSAAPGKPSNLPRILMTSSINSALPS
jgi:hypothetical protein